MDANPATELKSEAAFAPAIRALKKKKVSHVHNNTTATTRTHIPAVKATAPSSLRPTAGFWLAPDPLLTPVRDCPSPALPPADLPANAGGPRRWPRGSKGAGQGSSRRERSSRYLLQPRSLPPRRPRPSRPPGPLLRPPGSAGPGEVPTPPPPTGSPAHPRIPSNPAPGELTTCSSTWELTHQEGFLPTPQATPAPCGIPRSGGPRVAPRSGLEARPKLRLRRPLPARSEHYTMVEEEEAAAAGSGGGSGRRAEGAP